MNLKPLQELIESTSLEALRPFTEDEFLDSIRHGDFPKWRRLLSELPAIQPSSIEFASKVRIGAAADTSKEILKQLHTTLKIPISIGNGFFGQARPGADFIYSQTWH